MWLPGSRKGSRSRAAIVRSGISEPRSSTERSSWKRWASAEAARGGFDEHTPTTKRVVAVAAERLTDVVRCRVGRPAVERRRGRVLDRELDPLRRGWPKELCGEGEAEVDPCRHTRAGDPVAITHDAVRNHLGSQKRE